MLSPRTGGSITLNTSNPFDPPLIDPAYLTTAFDVFTMRAALKAAVRFLGAPAWEGYILQPFGSLAGINVTSESESDVALLDEYIRNGSGTSAHPVGTASMSAADAEGGVVDAELRLKHADGLRIVDASVFVRPLLPSRFPIYLNMRRSPSYLALIRRLRFTSLQNVHLI